MKNFLSSRLIQQSSSILGKVASSVQHLLMKAAVAISLKLCLYTARVLLNAAGQGQSREAA
ncbi:MAG: hypothetical protein AAFQ63_02610 [Cyanobacteria bacterium J06621_11]